MTELTIEAIGALLDQKLDEKLKDFPSKIKLNERLEELPTKAELDERLTELPTRQDYKVLLDVVNEINETVKRIDRRTDEDTRAAFKDIEKHEKRITALEHAVKLR